MQWCNFDFHLNQADLAAAAIHLVCFSQSATETAAKRLRKIDKTDRCGTCRFRMGSWIRIS